MDQEKYPSNSHKAKQEQKETDNEKRIGKVVQGTAIPKKKTIADQAKSMFIAEDLGSIRDYIVSDIIVTNLKKAIDDIVSNGVHMLLYGSAARPRNSSSSVAVNPSRVSYRNYYSGYSDSRSNQNRDLFNFSEYTLATRGEAEMVIDTLVDLISSYGMARVSDYYDAIGVSIDGNYTANDYGWRNLRDASVYRVDGRYAIQMPRPIPLR